jgi:flagellar basal-body rod protein FlgF
MVNGLYTASRAMTNILAKQDVHAQNIANASTNGFKMARLVNTAEVAVGRNDAGELREREYQQVSEITTSFAQGPMVNTGNEFDLALTTPGFFMVEAEDGVRYTRNGGFSLNSYGELVTLSGKRVLDEGGQPLVMKDGGDVRFMDDGSVFVDGQRSGKLGIVDFADPNKLRYGQDGCFGNPDAQGNPPIAPAAVGVKSGFLEGSNADPINTMVNMIADYRNYEAAQKAMHAVDETLGKAVNEVGRV